MSFKCGLVGMPNVGKSSIFNLLTEQKIPANNYPFCTIDPNIAYVQVPDKRLDALGETNKSENIVNASIALRNENYAEAKKYIDEAFETESTSNSPKMWNYRAPIYLQIALKEPSLDKEAALKAKEAHIKCLQKDKKGRVVVRKWTSEEDILAGLIPVSYTHLTLPTKRIV